MNSIFLSLLPLFLIITFFYILIKFIKGGFSSRGKIDPAGPMVCPTCGTRGQPGTKTRGSIVIEFLLWICFIIPGLIYSIWRLTTRAPICPACGAEGMIPANSPVGRRLGGEVATEKQVIEI